MCAVTETAEKKGRAQGMAEGMEKGRAEGLAEGMEKGMEKGRTEGKAEGKAEIIKAMHANGMTAEAIAAVIGFDLAAVEEILSQQSLL